MIGATSNTGPLMALAKIDALDLLADLFGAVRIPLAVRQELTAKTGLEVDRLTQANGTILRVEAVRAPSIHVAFRTRHLGAGEREAISLAVDSSSLLIIDDFQGRTAAKDLGIPVTGTAGVVLRAKQTGLVAAVVPLLEAMRQQGYWFSDALIHQAAILAGEA